MDNIGTRLRGERERLGRTQDDFAAIAGIGKRALIHYEKGERSPDANLLAAIAAAGADVLYILTGQRQPPPTPQAAPALSPRQAALLDNYLHCDEEGQRFVERAADHEAQHAKAKAHKAA